MGLLSQALKNFFPLNNGDNDFTSSCKIPYFNASNNPYGCVSPSKLASVLGVNSYFLRAVFNCDDINNTISYGYNNANNVTNKPSNIGTGEAFIFECFELSTNGTSFFQRWISCSTNKIYIRKKISGSSYDGWTLVS